MTDKSRIGRFYINGEYCWHARNGDDAVLLAAQSGVAIVRAEYRMAEDRLMCEGFCDEFCEVSPHCEPPIYQVTIEMTEDGPVRKAFVPDTGERNVKIEEPLKEYEDDAVGRALSAAMKT